MVLNKICVILICIALVLTGRLWQSFAQEARSPVLINSALGERIANYEMDVKLDVQNRLIDGAEILTWKNTTNFPTSELQFHLYYNAWRNDQSSMFQSVRYRSFDFSNYRDQDWAYCDVHSIKMLSGSGRSEADLTEKMEFIQPDDSNEHDRTVLRVMLPGPVAPGESIRLQIQWQSKVPRTFARTGVRGDYYFLAQWFPKVGVFENDGKWNCHQFIQTEFYANFGVYDVKLTVPTGWVVGATGKEVEQKDNEEGTTTHRYYQEDVHDFAWVTTPHFQVHTKRFEEPDLPTVDMRLLLMPDHAAKRDRYFAATHAALKYYGTWWGAYPYDHITIVDPAYRSGSGGMEYPTFFTGGARWLSPIESRRPEGVTVHEAGHQFWYGIIANNEFEHAWLDEGFNTFSTTRTLEQAYPNPVLTWRYFEGFIPIVFHGVAIAERTQSADGYFGFGSALKLDKMSTISWEYGPGAYGLNSYGKPGMMLRTLENYLGWETFQKAMSTYFDRWKFRHPTPQDFFDIVNEVSGKDMTWFFEQTYNSSNMFDYAVGSVKSVPVRAPKGYIEKDGELIFQKREKKEEDNDNDADASKQFQSTVFVRRWGEAVLPIEVKITFGDDDEVLENWDGQDRWVRFDYLKNSKITKVEVDPEHKLVLDVNTANNTWTSKPRAKISATKWASKWMIWMQSLLEFFAYFS
ncbi:MAG: M1 family metallopeptidase [bacterium]